jgi:LysM repeat protein
MYGAVRYSVHRGDTISTIARRFHVSQAQLREANHGSSRLHVGQRFNIVLADHTSSRRHHIVATRAKAKANTRKAASMKVAYNAPQHKQPD